MPMKMLVQSLVGALVFGLLLFVPAGTLAWPEAWIFLVLFSGCSVATGLWLLETDPALLAERTKSPLSADQKPGDRAVIAAICVAFCAWLILMAMDARRFVWSSVPLWAKAVVRF